MSWFNVAPWADVSGEDGVPIGGLTGQLLAKKSNNERDVEWIDPLAGADGREVLLQKGDTHIQWEYEGDEEWTDLVALTEITGEQGEKGDKGDKGDTGAGVNTGGTAGQALVKASATNYNTVWRSLILYGTGDPPSAVGVADGVIYVKYTA